MENTLQIPKPIVGHKEITVVIVEDIIKEANELRDILEKEFPNVKVLGDAQDFESAVELIMATQPMVVLMDIVLGGTYESFDVIRAVQNKGCKPFIPIFITAFGKNEYTVRAMEYTKIDYIDKPVDNNKLNKIMFEISKKLLVDSIENMDNEGLNDMMEMISKNKSPDVITVRDLEGNLVRVEMKKVIYLEAEGNRTYFVLSDGSLIKTNKGIKEYDDSLSNDYEFIRVHDAILLNLIFLQNYNHSKRSIKLITGGKPLSASQRFGLNLKSYLLKYDPTKLSLRERFF
jgi:two-component system, LytTR family, response regulator